MKVQKERFCMSDIIIWTSTDFALSPAIRKRIGGIIFIQSFQSFHSLIRSTDVRQKKSLWNHRYKFVELRYRRCDKEKPGDDARVETVVVFVPDVWTLMPTQAEFDAICSTMKEQLASKLAELDAQAAADEEQEKQQQQAGGKIQDKDSSATAVPMDTSTTMTKPEVEQA